MPAEDEDAGGPRTMAHNLDFSCNDDEARMKMPADNVRAPRRLWELASVGI